MGNIMNMLGLGMDMGVNFDNLSMAQKRMELGNMFDPMEAGRERLRANRHEPYDVTNIDGGFVKSA